MLLRIQRSVTSWWASTASMSKPSTTRRFPVERSCSESPLHLTTPLRWWVIFSVSGLLHQCSEDTACLCSLCTKDETGKHLSFRCHELDSVFPLLQHILHASLLGVGHMKVSALWLGTESARPVQTYTQPGLCSCIVQTNLHMLMWIPKNSAVFSWAVNLP